MMLQERGKKVKFIGTLNPQRLPTLTSVVREGVLSEESGRGCGMSDVRS